MKQWSVCPSCKGTIKVFIIKVLSFSIPASIAQVSNFIDVLASAILINYSTISKGHIIGLNPVLIELLILDVVESN